MNFLSIWERTVAVRKEEGVSVIVEGVEIAERMGMGDSRDV